ncbi:EVE domain-containing protein [Lignipirellula cremea]|uniref:EVE domain protein n=1 Tax=Lignipirellula cremea TaxID=2528010 RepID=A0A518E2R3_9BACT|nr:EVE domain-containing protein [Lignipirellula cremea]QDU98377.1 EVE domain protein [Lignipirellula cremea]
MARSRHYWLLKSEPDCFSIDDLQQAPDQTTYWDGVRNYQARNFLRDSIKQGDRVLYYHSNAKPPGVAGVAKVVRDGYPDFTAWDPKDAHFDPKSKADDPTWYMVDVAFERKFAQLLPLDLLRQQSELADMELLRKGSRLSVQPVAKAEFDAILKLARRQAG